MIPAGITAVTIVPLLIAGLVLAAIVVLSAARVRRRRADEAAERDP